ncbi:hypothetical protein BHYA_0150g00220 [Botrytis hyacinthi]|uniref:Uncharacterized protein n=1 Tax=Botrytis hyacinthi TaxID=278943 RepID=A0A4Z1GG52_9HELO|nr:hypothetical protein BHYA_0150g00220 [Botrytis hyacinthi]
MYKLWATASYLALLDARITISVFVISSTASKNRPCRFCSRTTSWNFDLDFLSLLFYVRLKMIIMKAVAQIGQTISEKHADTTTGAKNLMDK